MFKSACDVGVGPLVKVSTDFVPHFWVLALLELWWK